MWQHFHFLAPRRGSKSLSLARSLSLSLSRCGAGSLFDQLAPVAWIPHNRTTRLFVSEHGPGHTAMGNSRRGSRRDSVQATRPWNVSFVDQGNAMINADGQRIKRRQWRTPEMLAGAPPKAIVFFCHGFADHSERQTVLADRLTPHNIFMACHDHVGHGRSDGYPAHVDDFDVYIRDVIDATVPPFALTQPLLDQLWYVGTDGAHIGLAKILAAINPRIGVKKLSPDYMSRNQDTIDAFRNDPLTYKGKALAGWGVQILKSMLSLESLLPTFTAPLLVMHGGADKVTSLDGSEFLVENVGSQEKELKVYEGMYHDLMHELPEDTDKVLDDMCHFIRSHIPGEMPAKSQEPTPVVPKETEVAAAAEPQQEEGPVAAEQQEEVPVSTEQQKEAPVSTEHQKEAAPAAAEQQEEAPVATEQQEEAPVATEQQEEAVPVTTVSAKGKTQVYV
ncbi:uncharacterized protein MONBRDRAFT_24306 [Monosiga brevicollis MX1]|uniref:Serine aminopeptidase S33 domain-containing protein n=1 Tax=Monosiga brevicollis TaxID=81824 RepID=A9UW09_MONBE|nr:uncharacterized protein MONBRDRAFT_24306 [Monosiga brevicollis MX1]EDQ90479.1 predicted protein [Monosiga brevicollis MX1]|eukprot:XP_001744530.1 hypothetical protein [Monosiga brevicollis MX1]